MPTITRRFLGTAAAFLLLGVAVGFAMLLRRELWRLGPTPGLVSAHTHLILVGAVIQVIIGTAWWFFPRPSKQDPPASERAAYVAWWCLTFGTLVRAAAEATVGLGGARMPLVIVAGGVLQVAGMIAAVVALRRRVRAGRNPMQIS